VPFEGERTSFERQIRNGLARVPLREGGGERVLTLYRFPMGGGRFENGKKRRAWKGRPRDYIVGSTQKEGQGACYTKTFCITSPHVGRYKKSHQKEPLWGQL